MSSPLTLTVKQGPTAHELSLAADCTLAQLQQAVEAATGVFARQQKLIFKGKVLDASKRLAEQGVRSGVTIMLLAAAAGAGVTKGQQAASAVSQQKAAEVKARLEAAFGRGPVAGAASSSIPAVIVSQPGQVHVSGTVVTHLAERHRSWRATGIITLRELGLPSLPPQLFSGAQDGQPSTSAPADLVTPDTPSSQQATAWLQWAASTRALDLCHNKLTSLPAALSTLTGLTSLRLSHNPLVSTGCPWQALAALTALTLLACEHTHLDHMPDGVMSGWGQLRMLSFANNQLQGSLPADIGCLTCLELLNVSGNQLDTLPSELGQCTRLVELSASDNRITSIPEPLSNCSALQVLKLDKNRIPSVPSNLLAGCSSLWLLSLVGNPISLDQLRETEGYSVLDARRKARADKQIDGRVLLVSQSAFSEGADAEQWGHWQLDARKL